MALNPGDTLLNGHYRITRQLGRGGFGYVYQAQDSLLGEDVALKELIPALVGDEAMLKRFLAEARATMRLTHRQIVRTHNVFQEGGNYYIVMEYMAGGSLEDRLRQHGPLPIDEAVRIAAQVCEGLACAHGEGVVHCDLKPANILFTTAGEAKVADFGIAHVSGEMLTRSWMTPAGFVAGTLPYMSPEQTEGVRDDPRVDVYAVGAVLYRMLTGRPYLSFDHQETPRAQADNVYRIYNEEPAPPSDLNPQLPAWLDGVVLKALAKRPETRYASAGELRAALVAREAPSPAVEAAQAPTVLLDAEPPLEVPPSVPMGRAEVADDRLFFEVPTPEPVSPAAGAVDDAPPADMPAPVSVPPVPQVRDMQPRAEPSIPGGLVPAPRRRPWLWTAGAAVLALVLLAILVVPGLDRCGGATPGPEARLTPTVRVAVASSTSANTPTPTAGQALASRALTATPSPVLTNGYGWTTPTSTMTPTLAPSATQTEKPTSTIAPAATAAPLGADRVVAFNPGPGAQAAYTDPEELLGAPDLVENPCCSGMLQLGKGGSVLLAFTDKAIVDGPGDDFRVYGESAEDDYLLVEASADGKTWKAYPKMSESPGGLDLADVGLDRAVYLRLTDLQPATATGAEVDAVLALNSGPGSGLPTLTDAVARKSVTLREGPDQGMKAVGEAQVGTGLAILGRSPVNGWVKVKVGNGAEGWAPLPEVGLNVSLSEYALAQAPSTPTSAAILQSNKPTGRIVFDCANCGGSQGILVMNADGSGVKWLWKGSSSWGVAMSPDGTRIAFAPADDNNLDVYTMRADGTGVTRLTNHSAIDAMPAWSPDSKQIVFISERDGNSEVYVMNADGSGQRKLSNNPGRDWAPVWSPNGRHIAFESSRRSQSGIYLMNADGSGVTFLVEGQHPSWSPDGKRIAFDQSQEGISVMNADGSGKVLLRERGHLPEWSPDGRQIAYRDYGTEIGIMDSDGGGAMRLTYDLGYIEEFSWSR